MYFLEKAALAQSIFVTMNQDCSAYLFTKAKRSKYNNDDRNCLQYAVCELLLVLASKSNTFSKKLVSFAKGMNKR